jgi:hypothetical protein
MPPVFGRSLPDPHPYDAALASLLAATTDERAIALNLMHDHRVSPAREREFDAFVKPPCTDVQLRLALDEYFHAKVRHRKLPHYVYHAVNANNLLNGQVAVRPMIRGDVQLVRVLDLNGLNRVFQWAYGVRRANPRWGRTFDRFPRNISDGRAVLGWLDEKMQPRTVESFVATVLDVLRTHRAEKKAYQPTWATTWAAFKEHVAAGPDRWCQVLGIDKPRACWVILLRYTVREAGTIARPTQLDCGWHQFHFPSPPGASLSTGGHPMDISTVPPANRLRPEFIHKQPNHLLEHWLSLAPNNYGRTTAPTAPSLSAQRQTHHQLLAQIYGSGVYQWLPNPI